MDGLFLQEQIQTYYEKYFPFSCLFNWLGYFQPPPATNSATTETYFARRQFSFTLQDDIYIRYKCFSTVREMRDQICKNAPFKIDIGAVFSIPPKMHGTIQASRLIALEKEFVFDIDMTDYDDVRTCCTGANICQKCWKFMQVAALIIDTVLRQDLGFKHLLWVYSGRRGIHCWVSDQQARTMTNQIRSAVLNYMTLVTGSDQHGYKIASDQIPMHPSVKRAVNDLYPKFKEIVIQEQKIMDQPKHLARLLAFIPDKKYSNVKKEINDAWTNMTSDIQKWEFYQNILRQQKAKDVLSKVILCYLYPRIDVNVSKTVNHLLKSPFCVHPKTGRICVTLSSSQLNSFDPLSVPTVTELLTLADDQGLKKLSPYLTSFNQFLERLKIDQLELKKQKLRKFKAEKSLQF